MPLRLLLLHFLLISGVLLSSLVFAKPVSGFLPKGQEYLKNISTPEQVLGFELGERHAKHYQIQQFFTQLSRESERVTLTKIGKTYQRRDQFIVTLSAPKNINN